jgi:sugar porter (SP) family MFS transporter
VRSNAKTLLFVTLVSLISAMGGFLFGYETVVIAGTIAPVAAEFGLSTIMEGWFVSSGLVGCMLGVVIAGVGADRYGRKRVLVASGLLLTIASVGCALAPDTTWLVTLRIVGGVGVGLASIVSPLYISEVSPPDLRGRLVSVFQLTITIGIVAAMIANALLQEHAMSVPHGSEGALVDHLFVNHVWRGMFALQAIPSVLFTVLSMMVPDSPRWLVVVGRRALATEVLLRLRGDERSAAAELESIQESVSAGDRASGSAWAPARRRALRIGVFLTVFSELSGITIVMYYGPTILTRLGLSSNGALDGHAVIGIVLALCTLLAVWLVDRLGRRRLLMAGVFGAMISLLSAGIALQVGGMQGYGVLALLCAFVAFFAFSIGPIKWIVISEIFPTRIRARAMSIATAALWATDAGINFLFPEVRDRFGVSAMFFLCAALLAIQLIVVWRALPETKGMTLEAIESLWKRPGDAK